MAVNNVLFKCISAGRGVTFLEFSKIRGQHIVSILFSLKMDHYHTIVVFVEFWKYWPSESDYGYIVPIVNLTEAGIWGKSKAGAVRSGSSPLGLDW